jgi:hypothetical protein
MVEGLLKNIFRLHLVNLCVKRREFEEIENGLEDMMSSKDAIHPLILFTFFINPVVN